jgi:predicted RNA binding protein YcfA (HicA-like mRNA interferase family)
MLVVQWHAVASVSQKGSHAKIRKRKQIAIVQISSGVISYETFFAI